MPELVSASVPSSQTVALRAHGLEECGSLVSHNLSVSKHIGFEVLSAYSAHVCHPDLLREGGFIQFIPKEGLPLLWRGTRSWRIMIAAGPSVMAGARLPGRLGF